MQIKDHPFLCYLVIDHISHGCFLKNVDRTNKIIAAGEKCLVATGKFFWKDPSDIKRGIKTRSRAKNEPTASYEDYDRYILQNEFILCRVTFFLIIYLNKYITYTF